MVTGRGAGSGSTGMEGLDKRAKRGNKNLKKLKINSIFRMLYPSD